MTSEHQGTEANLLACFGGVWNGRKGLSATRQGVAALGWRVHGEQGLAGEEEEAAVMCQR